MLITRHQRPVMTADKPWEAEARSLYAITALAAPDGTGIRLYYLARHEDRSKSALCMALTKDGLEWEKPDLGDGTNRVMFGSGNTCSWGEFLPKRVLYDPLEPGPGRAWKMLYWDCGGPAQQPGLHLAVSEDGIVWHTVTSMPAIAGANDAASMVNVNPTAKQGPFSARFLLYQQTWRYNPALPADRDNLKYMHRRISLWAAKAFETGTFGDGWIGPVTILEPDDDDPPDLQYYWMTVFHREDGYGALLNCHHTTTQEMDVRLLRSDDGWTWDFLNDRKPLIGLGETGNFDCGMVIAVSPPVTFAGQTFLYYNGRATVHDHALRYPDMPKPEPASGIGLCTYDSIL